MTTEVMEPVQLQKEEVDVLESIYLNDMKLLKSSYPFKLEVICKPFTIGTEVSDKSYNLKVIVDFVKSYPLEGKPRVSYEPLNDITQDHVAEIELLTSKILARNTGLPIVFEIVESVRDWIQCNIIDLILEEKNKAQEKAKIIYHRPTFDTYTPCTLENFLKWKAKFEEDMAKLKAKNPKDDETKLTGRQFFQRLKEQPTKEAEEEEPEEEDDDSDYNEEDSDNEEFDEQKPFN
ncbi:hypothetical protein ABPG74_012018 [Tetrahymena malaccensis]